MNMLAIPLRARNQELLTIPTLITTQLLSLLRRNVVQPGFWDFQKTFTTASQTMSVASINLVIYSIDVFKRLP